MLNNAAKQIGQKITPSDVFSTMKEAFDLYYTKAEVQTIETTINNRIDALQYGRVMTNAQLASAISSKSLKKGELIEIPYPAKHKFSILLVATSTNTVSGVGYAINNLDTTYYSGVDMTKWLLGVTINDSGIPTITYMRDEYGNEANYDFKNSSTNSSTITYALQYTDSKGNVSDASLTGKAKNNKLFDSVGNKGIAINTTSSIINNEIYGGVTSTEGLINCKIYGTGNILKGATNLELYGDNNSFASQVTNAEVEGNNITFTDTSAIYNLKVLSPSDTACSLSGLTGKVFKLVGRNSNGNIVIGKPLDQIFS
jgi:hypothetical protein